MRSRRRLILAAAALLSVGAAVFGGISLASAGGSQTNLTGDQSVTPVSYSANHGWAPAIPSSASTPAGIVSAIVDSAGLAKTVTAGLDSSPAEASRSGSWLTFDVSTDGSIFANIHAAWEADLVEGVVAEAFAAHGMPAVIGSTVTGDLPSGQTVALQGGMGDVASGQSFSSDSDAAIEQHLTDALAQANLTPVSITVMHVGQPAPAVVVKTDDPASAAGAAASVLQSLFGANPPLYEGYYFEIENAAGVPLLVQSAAFRTGAGRQWVDPSIAASSSLIHG
jgi:hypothetical protein